MGSSSKRLLIAGAVTAFVLVLGAGGFALFTWGKVNRVTIDRPAPAQAAGGQAQGSGEDDVEGDSEELTEPTSSGLDVLLLVGSDSRDDLIDLNGFGAFEGRRADVVMVMLRTEAKTAILSLPRDLWVDNLCSTGQTRLNTMLEGCGDEINGPTLLTLTVEDLIGQTVDHFAMVDLAGFQEAVNAVGGYEICVDKPVRDRRSNLELPAGCTMASGDQTLAWLRSRSTQELTASGWRVMPGVNDLARNERQRVFLIDMLAKMSDVSSPQSLASTARSLAPYLTVDADLTLTEAVDIAWTMRGIGAGSIEQLEVPVYDFTTDNGAAVLISSVPVDEIVAEFLAPGLAGKATILAG